MRQKRMILLGLIVLALLVGPGFMRPAEAQVRVSATVRTPNVRVSIGNTHPGYHLIGRRGHLPMRGRRLFTLSKQDRVIARRLARYTGVPAREIIQARRYGYNWFEIGRWLRLPRFAVRAAMNQRSWNRFIRGERRIVRHKKMRPLIPR